MYRKILGKTVRTVTGIVAGVLCFVAIGGSSVSTNRSITVMQSAGANRNITVTQFAGANRNITGVQSEIQQLKSDSRISGQSYTHFDETFIAAKQIYDTEADNWGISRMNFESYNDFVDKYKADKSEVVVAVIDTGLNEDSSSIFDGRVLEGASFTYVDERKPGRNDNSDYADDNGHGTAVSGIIAQSTEENVKILPIKCLNSDGAGSELAVYMGIMYALNNGADIINMSCCADGSSMLYESALAQAYRQGVSVVVAAGNEAQDVANVSPACIPSAITVSCTDSDDFISGFSNYGKYIDFAAPGENVSLTYYKGGSIINSGTSFSAPLVSSAVACLLGCNPDFEPDEIQSILQSNVIDLGDEGWDEYFGYGLIDMQLLEDDVLRYIIEPDGDADEDGAVDINDVLYVLKAAVGEIEMDDIQRAKIGVYGEQPVTSSLALAIMRMVVGVDSSFNINK